LNLHRFGITTVLLAGWRRVIEPNLSPALDGPQGG
jgi:hypothetical protein